MCLHFPSYPVRAPFETEFLCQSQCWHSICWYVLKTFKDSKYFVSADLLKNFKFGFAFNNNLSKFVHTLI